MPVATQDPQELMKALLQQKGLLATGGNIRSLPFADGQAPSPSASSASAGVAGPSAGTDATRPQGATPLVKGNTLIDPQTQQPIEGQLADDWWKYLLAGAGAGGAGYALYKALQNRKGGAAGDPTAEAIPTVEGEVVSDPLSPLPGNSPQEGEYYPVGDDTQLAPSAKQLTDQSTAQVLADRNKQLTSRNRPNPNPIPESDTSVIRGTDTVSDLSPQEMEQAKTLAAQLVANRQKGNASIGRQTNLKRRYNLPTGDTNENSLLNTVIRLIREGKASSLVRAVP